jgi:hypothetical protein
MLGWTHSRIIWGLRWNMFSKRSFVRRRHLDCERWSIDKSLRKVAWECKFQVYECEWSNYLGNNSITTIDTQRNLGFGRISNFAPSSRPDQWFSSYILDLFASRRYSSCSDQIGHQYALATVVPIGVVFQYVSNYNNARRRNREALS